MTWLKRHYKKLIISVLGLAVILFIVIGIPLEKSNYTYQTTQDFTTDGFVEAQTLTNTSKVVAKNSNYELIFDETTSYFEVHDLKNNTVWRSNPTEADLMKTITPTARERQLSTLEITYLNKTGSSKSVNNYSKSIYHPEGIAEAAGRRTYQVKYVDNAVQIYYNITNLEITYLYFPKYIPIEMMDNFSEADQTTLKTFAYTSINDDKQAYENQQFNSNMSSGVKRRLYNALYVNNGFTLEQVNEINSQFEVTEFYEQISFKIAVEVKLLETGIETSVLRNSITEQGGEIVDLNLYPLFGTAVSSVNEEPTEGYLVIPDGTGAIINFNNGKTSQNVYRKRLYGQDISVMPQSMDEQQQKISIPVYGMVKENSGFAAIITEGDAMAYINADISGRVDSYNKIYASFQLRETEQIILGSGFNTYGIRMWTKDIVQTDFTVRYSFLNDTNNSYVGIADEYRQYLIKEKNMTEKDETDNVVVTTELIGAFDRIEFFLGVPYSTLDSLTTFEQSKLIIEELEKAGISNINVSYLGLANGGLTNQFFDRNDVAKVLGGEEGLVNLEKYLTDKNIDLYQQTNFATTKAYRGFLDQNRYNSTRVSGQESIYFGYHYPSRLPESEFDDQSNSNQFVISPLYYQGLYDKFNESLTTKGLNMNLIGSNLASDYEYHHTIYKQDAVILQEDFLSNIEQNILLSSPLGFALPYATLINNLSTETTLYALVDYQVPLLQLVLSGLVDYTAESLNITSNRSLDYQFLKSLETGSNLKYTLSYEDSQKLLSTEHNQYMSTHYVNWINQMKEQVETMDTLNIHGSRLINHERVQADVYQVTYENGLTLLINYNIFQVTVNGKTVSPINYIVLQEAN